MDEYPVILVWFNSLFPNEWHDISFWRTTEAAKTAAQVDPLSTDFYWEIFERTRKNG